MVITAQPAPSPSGHEREDRALSELLEELHRLAYRFVTPTPATHARVLKRPNKQRAGDLRDALGWNLPFGDEAVPGRVRELLERGGALAPLGGGSWRSKVRVSSLDERLFLHSAFPTDAEDAVFFGPDSYRFASLIRAELTAQPLRPGTTIVDIGAGAGAGVGAIVAAALSPDAEIIMTDINAKALRLARINALHAGVNAQAIECEGVTAVPQAIDLALANPPYMIDGEGRDYRDGGGMHGGKVALDMARAALPKLAPGGRLILYTGSAIVDGRDELRLALEAGARDARCMLRYREIDPDVFGEELEGGAYRDVDRIALIAAIVARPTEV